MITPLDIDNKRFSKQMVNGYFVNIEKEILMKSQEGTGKVVKIFYLLLSEN